MEVMVSKGFLVLAENSNSVNYVRLAYGLALSIKSTQKEINNISLMTNDTVPDEYKLVFDQIIPIPWIDPSKDTRFKAENRWKLYHKSPYEETIVLDVDMIVLEDLTEWWNYCSNYDIKICSKVRNHKLEIVTSDVYRKAFTKNRLTNAYFGLHYFKKSIIAHEFYKLLEFVCNNWQYCYDQFAPEEWQDWLSMDLAAAIAIEMSGLQEQAIDVCCPLEFIHMKTGVQEWDAKFESWRDAVPWWLNKKGDLVVGNIKQSKIFHYVEKDFLTPDMLLRLEELAHGNR